MGLIALVGFGLMLFLSKAAILPSNAKLGVGQGVFLGALTGSVVAEIVGLSFTLASILSALVGAALAFVYPLVMAPPSLARGRVLTSA